MATIFATETGAVSFESRPISVELGRLDRLDQEAMRLELDRVLYSELSPLAPAEALSAEGMLSWFRDAADRVLRSVFEAAHQGLCGEEGKDLRNAVLAAAGIAGGAALIASGLVSLGIGTALATAVSAWIYKFIVKPSGKAFCEHWADSLPEGV
ncbi:MAG: hypothetical protein AAFZ07_04050 [Actinomycetota bacterium]